MAKSTFEKTTRNQTLSGGPPRNYGRDNWTYRIDVEPADRTLLKSFFGQELSFYNALVAGLASRLRAFPETLLEFANEWEALFADAAMLGVNVNRFRKPEELPTELQRYRNVLFTPEGQRRSIPERKMMVMELAAHAGNFDRNTRRGMALEVLRFYRLQAQAASQKVPTAMQEDMAYREVHEVLAPEDPMRKRHVQLHKSAVALTYDAETDKTRVRIPYARKPLIVPGDISRPNMWSLMIIRQAPDRTPDQQSPWLMELRKTPHQYLIKLVDSINPRTGRAFAVGKTARSAV